eukprot:EG_transcript_13550
MDHDNPPISSSHAFGPFVDGPDSLQFFDTHWPRFFYWWITQLKHSQQRVFTPEEADFVVVPVCLGVCSRPLQKNDPHVGRSFNLEDADKILGELVPLLPHLDRKPHVLVVNSGVDHRVTSIAELHRFYVIGLELPQTCDTRRFISAPYPSHEHPNVFENLESPVDLNRQMVFGMFQVRPVDKGRVRQRLMWHCKARRKVCEYKQWYIDDKPAAKAALYLRYRKAFYCLQPPGDWLLRGAFYDCLVAGGLPVVFHPNYTHVAAFSDVLNYSHFVMTVNDSALPGVNLIDHIVSQHSPQSAFESLRRLMKVRRLFIYTINPLHALISFKRMNIVDQLDDAFTFSMKALLRALCRNRDAPVPLCSSKAPKAAIIKPGSRVETVTWLRVESRG